MVFFSSKSARLSGLLAAALILVPPAFAAGFSFDKPDADIARAALAHAAEDGLDPDRYRLAPNASDDALAAVLETYMKDLRLGRRDLEGLDRDIELPPEDFDAGTALTDALTRHQLPALLSTLAPSDPQYAGLKIALARYRAIAGRGGWPVLPRGTGLDDPLLLQRLAYEDPDARPGSDPVAALKRFQVRNGLTPDGVLGKASLAALNVSAQARVETIQANMERRRWLPRTLEPDRIVINVPDATLQLWLKGEVVLTSRVIVGRPRDPTPILRAEGAGLTVNPPWTVPASIAAREILPQLKKNRAYLANHDMVLLNGPPGDPQGLSVDWRRIPRGTFPYVIRQHPGPKNPLGQVKIELPNRFQVYLHDTPTKSAFARNVRDLSHGCVRVEQILPLASYALSADSGSTDKILAAIGTGETSYMPLKRKLPVYFLYWTAFADSDGAPAFRADIYGRDQRLIAAMRSPTRLAETTVGCARG